MQVDVLAMLVIPPLSTRSETPAFQHFPATEYSASALREVQRVFYDRLVNEDDRLWFEGMVIELLVRTFRVRLENKMESDMSTRRSPTPKTPTKWSSFSLITQSTTFARVLRQPRGNIMLIGVGGSGKQSLVRLASYMLEF